MTKYRILEKTGTWQKPDYMCGNPKGCNSTLCKETHLYIIPAGKIINKNKEVYIPKFIVQEYTFAEPDEKGRYIKYPYRDLKEFTDLEEARKYKHELELKEGIVRE